MNVLKVIRDVKQNEISNNKYQVELNKCKSTRDECKKKSKKDMCSKKYDLCLKKHKLKLGQQTNHVRGIYFRKGKMPTKLQ